MILKGMVFINFSCKVFSTGRGVCGRALQHMSVVITSCSTKYMMNSLSHTRRCASVALRDCLLHPSARITRPELGNSAVNNSSGGSSFSSSSASSKHDQGDGNESMSRNLAAPKIRGYSSNAASLKAPTNGAGATFTRQGSGTIQHQEQQQQEQQHQKRSDRGFGARQQSSSFDRIGGAPLGQAHAPKSALPDDIDALYHQMQHLGSRWADLHAEAELLEESKKCVLASITLHYMNDGDNKSSGETKAFAAPEYREHVQKMVEARRRANQAKVEFEGMKAHLNLTRTYEASRREEMKLM